jgi:hypothetical protein
MKTYRASRTTQSQKSLLERTTRPITTTVSIEWVTISVSCELQSQFNLEHFDHHYDPKIRKKVAVSNADLNADASYFPDKLEILKDQNLKLKSHHKELEEQVKIIATKLKRQITQLKKDRIVGGKNYFTA